MSSPIRLHTARLTLALQTLDEVRASVAAMDDASRAQISPDWLDRLNASTGPDPWVQSFSMVRKDDGVIIGQCGFKGPPDDAGVVEIAYGVSADAEVNGFATEAAQALLDYALTIDQVRLVRAHTLPDGRASQRVLAKCGFKYLGDITDPQDGVISRFEVSGRQQ
jgi:RimJ/RimL family protein N-acetyltransferase